MPATPAAFSVCYSHVHIYCDRLQPVAEYQKLEAKLNSFADRSKAWGGVPKTDVAAGRKEWLSLEKEHGDPVARVSEPEDYRSVGQDVVEQMLVGLGWRVTGTNDGPSTSSVVVTSQDPDGVKFVITAHKAHALNALASAADGEPKEKRPRTSEADPFDHFDGLHLERFAKYHNGRQGVAVLGFVVSQGGIEEICSKYKELHPKLLISGEPREYAGNKVLEVFAYYRGEKFETDADPGTVVRFVEPAAGQSGTDLCVLPGIQRVCPKFDGTSQPAYCDHWVSNVISRTGFLDTLEDTLGFTPKVDFNAGVVAAGEAQIESTVTGNSSAAVLSDPSMALKDQSQVYLPINNALSEDGHVHVFLKELGQGVQHVASRVEDLAQLVQRANDYRKMTGSGLSFLQIPRSYYGYITANRLSQDAGIDAAAAEKCIAALKDAGIIDGKDIVDLEATLERVAGVLPGDAPPQVAEHVLRARYGNLYSLLHEHASEETYLGIVRNNILVDIQGEDLLLQIFTSKILQRSDGEESPFLEFIQRVCSECKDAATGCPKAIKPGCGGFGIRNFLTLFLSIEVSKASAARTDALKASNAKLAEFEGRRVDAFTEQLAESNPILTAISDAMTAEGKALEEGDEAEAERWAKEKALGNEALKTLSMRYKELMKRLREEQAAAGL